MRVITGGSHEFNALMYGQKNTGTINYLRNQVSDYASQVMANMTDAGKAFLSNVGQMFEAFNGSEAMRRARTAFRKVENLFTVDVIRGFKDISDMQQALPLMQRMVLAEPTVRQAYLDQRIDGYSETFINVHGNDVGQDHYDYRLVMDGVPTEDAEGNEVIRYFFDDTEGDIELNIEDRADILSVWDMARAYVEIGKEDPTSAWGGLM